MGVFQVLFVILSTQSAALDNTVLISIITAISVLISTLITTGFKFAETWYNGRQATKKEKSKTPLVDVSKVNMATEKILYSIIEDSGANIATLSRFHNGGYFIDGLTMDKFTTTNHVTKDSDLSTYHIQLPQNILLSIIPDIMYELLFTGKYYEEDINNIKNSPFKQILKKIKGKSLFMFLIKDLDDKPLGFISILYNNENHILGDKEIDFIHSKHNEVLNLMKMTDYKK